MRQVHDLALILTLLDVTYPDLEEEKKTKTNTIADLHSRTQQNMGRGIMVHISPTLVQHRVQYSLPYKPRTGHLYARVVTIVVPRFNQW